MSRWGITWALFILMAVTLPSFYFLIQAIVFAPLIAIVWSCFVEQGLAIWAGIHVVIIGLLYFGVAYLVSRMISSIGSTFVRNGIVLSIAALMIALTFLPIYISGGHGSTEYNSWIGSFRQFGK